VVNPHKKQEMQNFLTKFQEDFSQILQHTNINNTIIITQFGSYYLPVQLLLR